jgi:hypothetical protein
MMINLFDWLGQTAVDPISPLLSMGGVGILAACAIIVAVALWRREVKTLDLARAENAELHKEIKELNADLQRVLVQLPRTQSSISEAIDIMRQIK